MISFYKTAYVRYQLLIYSSLPPNTISNSDIQKSRLPYYSFITHCRTKVSILFNHPFLISRVTMFYIHVVLYISHLPLFLFLFFSSSFVSIPIWWDQLKLGQTGKTSPRDCFSSNRYLLKKGKAAYKKKIIIIIPGTASSSWCKLKLAKIGEVIPSCPMFFDSRIFRNNCTRSKNINYNLSF